MWHTVGALRTLRLVSRARTLHTFRRHHSVGPLLTAPLLHLLRATSVFANHAQIASQKRWQTTSTNSTSETTPDSADKNGNGQTPEPDEEEKAAVEEMGFKPSIFALGVYVSALVICLAVVTVCVDAGPPVRYDNFNALKETCVSIDKRLSAVEKELKQQRRARKDRTTAPPVPELHPDINAEEDTAHNRRL